MRRTERIVNLQNTSKNESGNHSLPEMPRRVSQYAQELTLSVIDALRQHRRTVQAMAIETYGFFVHRNENLRICQKLLY